MVYHFLPKSKFVDESTEAYINACLSSWLDDWFGQSLEAFEINIQIDTADFDSLKSFRDKASVSWWSCVNAENNPAFAMRLHEHSKNGLIRALTGFDRNDVKQTLVNFDEMIQSIMFDLSKSLCRSSDIQQCEDGGQIASIECDEGINPSLIGRHVYLRIGEIVIELLIPNEMVRRFLPVVDSSKNDIALVDRRETVSHINVKLSAKIDGFNIKLKDLQTLQVGDVLTTRQNAVEQITGYINDSFPMSNQFVLGKNANKVALKING